MTYSKGAYAPMRLLVGVLLLMIFKIKECEVTCPYTPYIFFYRMP